MKSTQKENYMTIRNGRKTRRRRGLTTGIPNTTFRGIDKTGSKVIRYAVTDHTGIIKRLFEMPSGRL
jgi:hypothetical protein